MIWDEAAELMDAKRVREHVSEIRALAGGVLRTVSTPAPDFGACASVAAELRRESVEVAVMARRLSLGDDDTRRAFDQGFVCALVALFDEFPALRQEVASALEANGIRSLEDASAMGLDEYDEEKLREIFGADAND